jgi:hypothetical protein
MRLHRQQHQVLRPRRAVIVSGLDRREDLVAAVGENEPDAVRLERREILAARDEGDILPGSLLSHVLHDGWLTSGALMPARLE